VLFFWGPQVRKRSKFASIVLKAEEAKAAEEAEKLEKARAKGERVAGEAEV